MNFEVNRYTEKNISDMEFSMIDLEGKCVPSARKTQWDFV